MRDRDTKDRGGNGAGGRGPGGGPRPARLLPLLLAALLPLGCGEASGGGGAREDGQDAGSGEPATQAAGGGAGIGIDPATGQIVRRQAIRVGGVPITVEIADTPELRGRGLMHRESLPEDYGMLFVYPEPGLLSFWMRNTLIPLDIAFIDANGVIVNIESMEPRTETQHVAKAPAVYALETRQGWFAEHGIGPGDRVEL